MYDYINDKRFRGIKPLKNKIWLASPTMHGEEEKYIHDAFLAGWVTTAGENIDALEKAVAEYIGVKYAVGLSSGTAALHMAIKLAGERLYGRAKPNEGILNGHKVFCSNLTFDASCNPISYEDGEAVFIDSEYDTWNISPDAIKRAFFLYPDVKIIVLAHLYGTPAKMDEIRAIADWHNALIIEDAAESLGACLWDDSKDKWSETGSLGDYNAISFNGNKIITGSSGGMFLTDSKEDADKVRKWSTQSRENAPWYQHEEIGYNYRMSNIVAGVVRGQLIHLQEHIDRKREIYERYKEELASFPVSMNPYVPGLSQPNFWLSCMMIDEDYMCSQERSDNEAKYEAESGKSCPTEILEALATFSIEGRPIWKPMHMQPIYRDNKYVTASDEEDVSGDIFRRGLCLPSDIKMTNEEQNMVIEIVKRCFD